MLMLTIKRGLSIAVEPTKPFPLEPIGRRSVVGSPDAGRSGRPRAKNWKIFDAGWSRFCLDSPDGLARRRMSANMKRMLFSGGLLANDAFTKTSTLVSHWPSEIDICLLGRGARGRRRPAAVTEPFRERYIRGPNAARRNVHCLTERNGRADIDGPQDSWAQSKRRKSLFRSSVMTSV